MPEDSVDDLARSFERHLCVQNKSPRRVEAYPQGGRRLRRLSPRSPGYRYRGLAGVRRQDVEGYVIDLLGPVSL
jgi:hypothetical protein